MKRKVYNSGFLKSAGYCDGVLEIEFSTGQIRQYHGVSLLTAMAFNACDAKGRFFREVIEGSYKSQVVDPNAPPAPICQAPKPEHYQKENYGESSGKEKSHA